MPQPKKIWPMFVAVAAFGYAINHPEKAAALINKVIHAISVIASSLGF
ncbi:hypothetical protein [Spirillospora sp. CA-128828]